MMDRDAGGWAFLHALRGEVPEEEKENSESDAETEIFSGRFAFPESFREVHEALRRFRQHEISRDDFTQSVETLMVRCSTLVPRVERHMVTASETIKVEQSVLDEFTQAGGMFSEGLQEAVLGMEELIALDDPGDLEHLDAAWERMRRGGEQIMSARAQCGELYASLCIGVANNL